MDDTKIQPADTIQAPSANGVEAKAENVASPVEMPTWSSTEVATEKDSSKLNETTTQSTTRAKWPLLIGVLVAALFVAVSIYFWVDSTKHFPELSPGSYIGTIKGVLKESETGEAAFYLEKFPGKDDLFFAVLQAGWKPQKGTSAIPAAENAKSQWILPLIISGPGVRLQLVGSVDGNDTYHGIVRDLTTGREGTWQLSPLRGAAATVEGKESDIKLWSLLRAELVDIQKKVTEFKQKADSQKAEIQKLTELITEGEQLRSRANDKFVSVRDELANLREQLANRQEEILRLEESFQISEKITGMGKLVSLSRESLDREWRAIDSLLRTEVSKESPALEEEVARAEKIIAIQNDITAEQNRIRDLESRARAGQTSSTNEGAKQ